LVSHSLKIGCVPITFPNIISTLDLCLALISSKL
jgi:hypothetical protein